MKNKERIKFTILGFIVSLVFFTLISSTLNSNNEGEVGRYQVVSSSGDRFSVYAIILDTKTGNFIEGESTSKAFHKKKYINKGSFKEIFNEAQTNK